MAFWRDLFGRKEPADRVTEVIAVLFDGARK